MTDINPKKFQLLKALPLEIENEIWMTVAIENLKDKLNQSGIDFETFNKFLLDHKAFVMGSFCLSCFDVKLTPKDIDIFYPWVEDYRRIYHGFFVLANEKKIYSSKRPLDTTYEGNEIIKIDYNYKFKIENDDCLPLEFDVNCSQNTNFDREDCSSIKYDGKSFTLPNYIRKNIPKFLLFKKSKAFEKKVLLDIYDPWGYDTQTIIKKSFERITFGNFTDFEGSGFELFPFYPMYNFKEHYEYLGKDEINHKQPINKTDFFTFDLGVTVFDALTAEINEMCPKFGSWKPKFQRPRTPEEEEKRRLQEEERLKTLRIPDQPILLYNKKNVDDIIEPFSAITIEKVMKVYIEYKYAYRTLKYELRGYTFY